MARFRLFAGEWTRLRRLDPRRSEHDLISEIVTRGSTLAAQPLVLQIPPAACPADQLAHTRTMFVQWAADYSWTLTRYLQHKPEADALRAEDERVLEEIRHLEQDVLPGLQSKAQDLRAELRALEAEAESRGIDTSAIEPKIDWAHTMFVEDCPRLLANIRKPLLTRLRDRLRRWECRPQSGRPD
jgi:hypothetical protein